MACSLGLSNELDASPCEHCHVERVPQGLRSLDRALSRRLNVWCPLSGDPSRTRNDCKGRRAVGAARQESRCDINATPEGLHFTLAEGERSLGCRLGAGRVFGFARFYSIVFFPPGDPAAVRACVGSGVGNTKTCRLSHCYSYRLLSTVAQHHIRRHEGHWPAHAEACDFYRDPDEQRVITASYAVPIEREWRLSRPLVGEALQPQLRVQRLSGHVARPRLARLLLHLMTEAGLQRICEDGAVPDFPGQVQALWTAAGSVNLDVEAPLRHFLCTSVARMPVLIERLERVRPGRFVHNRPHGILIVRLAGIAEGELFPLAGDPIAVRGRVAVFGENPERCRAASLRPPYLAACVVARAAADEAVEKLWGDRRGEGILAGVTNPSGVPDAPFKRPQPIPRPFDCDATVIAVVDLTAT